MDINFHQFANNDIMAVLGDAGNVSADLGLAMIEPVSVLIVLNQRYAEELNDFFRLCGVDPNAFYSKVGGCIRRYPQSYGNSQSLKISDSLQYALYLALQIESSLRVVFSPNSALVTALLMAEGPLAKLAVSFGLSTAKMQRALIKLNTESYYDGSEASAPAVIGLADEIGQIDRFVKAASKMRERSMEPKFECDTIIVGASGTGKSFLAQCLTKKLYDAGLVSKPDPVVVDAVNWRDFEENLSRNLESMADGVLVVDNAQKLVSGSESNRIGTLDTLFMYMDILSRRPVVVLVGLPDGMTEFMSKNPSVTRKFEYVFNLKNYSDEELARICASTVESKFSERLDSACLAKLTNIFRYLLRNKPDYWAGAHNAVQMADNIVMSFTMRGGSSISTDDIVGTEDRDLTVEEILAKLDDFVGVDNIRREILDMIAEIKFDRERFGSDASIRSHFVFTGNPGTGKTTMARVFADVLKAMKVLPTGQLIEADRSSLVSAYVGQTAIQTNALVDKAIGGVLFIDEAYTLVSDAGSSNGFGKEAIDTLLKRLEDDRGKFVCIVAGYTKEMHDFLQSNPGMQSRFNKVIEFSDYTGPQLAEIFTCLVKKNSFYLSCEARNNLVNFFNGIYNRRTRNFGNAREVRNIFDEAKKRQSRRLAAAGGLEGCASELLVTLEREDIEGDDCRRQVSVDEVLEEMQRDFIGMQSVKDAIRALSSTMAANRRRVEAGLADPSNLGIHILLTGNPGTGKTTVARTLGKVLKAIGILNSDKVVEADKNQMVGQYVGSTPQKVNDLVDRAMGGILFVDEAYTLSQDSSSSNSFGREAIETLMKRMEDDRGKFVCVLAGYRNLMDEFVRTNPGIDSRITHRLHIEDYNADELFDIFCMMVKRQKMALTSGAEGKVRQAVAEILTAKTGDFGNAREMRKLLDKTLERQSARVQSLPENASLDRLTLIVEDDIPAAVRKNIDERECLSRLDSLVGLADVKREIRSLAQYLRLEKMRSEALGKQFVGVRDHYLFLGNPGTGKTTVARILGEVFLALGISKNTNFIEVDRSALVAGYVGQTAQLTNRVIDRALGGILFIDEAYSLCHGPHDTFGQEAIDTLLKRMEDDRGKFVCIAAGYSREMQQFVASNSGLQSRFNKTISFQDYDVNDLMEIFKRKIASENFIIAEDALLPMLRMVEDCMHEHSHNFGNAREINNLFQIVKERQSNRIYGMLNCDRQPSHDDLLTLSASDFNTSIS